MPTAGHSFVIQPRANGSASSVLELLTCIHAKASFEKHTSESSMYHAESCKGEKYLGTFFPPTYSNLS